jgi:hypothetical protein
MNARFAHRDAVGVLRAVVTEAGGEGQIPESSILVANPKGATARRAIHAAAMIANERNNRGEITWQRRLRDEQNWIRQRRSGCLRMNKKIPHEKKKKKKKIFSHNPVQTERNRVSSLAANHGNAKEAQDSDSDCRRVVPQ